MLPLEGGIDFGPMMPKDFSEIIVGIILFFVILVVMWKVVVPRFETMYAERHAEIEDGLQRADALQAEADAALAQYQQQLAGARTEAARIREDAKNQGAQIIAEMRSQANAEADRIREQAHAQIEAEKARAAAQLRGEIGGLATGLASKIVGESLTDDERAQRTIERFIADLEQQPVPERA